MHIIQNVNMALLGIDPSLLCISWMMFIVSIITALVYIYKLVESKKNLKKAKRLYPDLIQEIERDIKKYTILFILVLILGLAQLMVVYCVYGKAYYDMTRSHSESSQPLAFILYNVDV